MKFAMDANPPPFWKQFGFFFAYLKQEKLYYQITLLAFAQVLTFIPVVIIPLLVAALLFLASYKLAFEVLHTVSSGQLTYADSRSYEIDDKIGFKAIVMGVIQILIFIFIYRSDPPLGFALLLLTTLTTPAYLMMLSKTQSVMSSLNPMNLMAVMSRIGFEYGILLVFFIACAAFNLAFRYFIADSLPGIIGTVITAWVLYFLLVFTFLVIGYVMYRHADELGQDTVDTEVFENKQDSQLDPIKERIKTLLEKNQSSEAIAIIKELKKDDNRTDLDAYLAEAENLLLANDRLRPTAKLEQLMTKKQFNAAIVLMLEYLEDGHFIKPKNASDLSQLIDYAFTKNQFKTVLKLSRDFHLRYPHDAQEIVDNYFLVAKIQYQNNNFKAAEKLLTSITKKYQNQANIKGPSSYLKGMQNQQNN